MPEVATAEPPRKAAPVAEAAPLPPGHVAVRVMKRGHERIFTGEHCPKEDVKFPTFKQGDQTTIARDTAIKYEDLGWVEILP